MNQVDIDKTLCKQCETCQEFTYQRTITRGKRKGELWKFKYCKGNSELIKLGDWGPDISKIKSGDKEYASLTRRREGKKYHFTAYLKKDPRNSIIHIGETLDCRMKMLREVSVRCKTQTLKGKESKFPGVGIVSTYKENPNKNMGKKIWWARIKINRKTDYLDNYYTELEAAHAYYSKCEELNLDINKETPEYRIYQRWLNVKEFTDELLKRIHNDYKSKKGVNKDWYLQLIKSAFKNNKI